MTNRDELINELCGMVTLGSCAFVKGCHENEELADFILARERKMLEEIEKPLKTINDMENLFCSCCEDTQEAIDEALAIIQAKKGTV